MMNLELPVASDFPEWREARNGDCALHENAAHGLRRCSAEWCGNWAMPTEIAPFFDFNEMDAARFTNGHTSAVGWADRIPNRA
jgi:hypothetical protein